MMMATQLVDIVSRIIIHSQYSCVNGAWMTTDLYWNEVIPKAERE